MVNADENAIEIPIEIRTKDFKEIQKAKREVDAIERKIKKIKDTQSKQATPTIGEETRGGIFGGARDVKAKPFRDKKSKGAIVKENVVTKKLDALEEAQKKVNQKLGNFTKTFGVLPLAGTQGLQSFALKFVPFIAVAMVAKGVFDTMLQFSMAPGRFLDRRLKILIDKQFFKLTQRKEAAELSSIHRTLRVTSSPSLRGPTTQIFNTQQLLKRGVDILSENQEALAKDVLP